jgi:glycosyltransferase involved in cell wall biosynthesis
LNQELYMKHFLFFIFFFHALSIYAQIPRVSVITSVFKADKFIAGFCEDIERQTIFKECEFIIINANSPGTEDNILTQFARQHTNIIYIKLDQDPGLYAVWNRAIQMARAKFITNWNVDDRRNPKCLAAQAYALEKDKTVDLVYADFYLTRFPNEPYSSKTRYIEGKHKEFSVKNMESCLPGPMPMWRKLLHEKYGYFDETFYIAGDYEMWLRAVNKGSRFKKIPGFSGIFYLNGQGLSYSWDIEKIKKRAHESERIKQLYAHLWK